MKRSIPTMREINAAREKIDIAIRVATIAWMMANPRPSYKVEESWERKHRSPRRIHDEAKEKALKHLYEKREALMFDARMGKITAAQLYDAAKSFR